MPNEVADAVIEILAALVLARIVSEGVWASQNGEGDAFFWGSEHGVPLVRHARDLTSRRKPGRPGVRPHPISSPMRATGQKRLHGTDVAIVPSQPKRPGGRDRSRCRTTAGPQNASPPERRGGDRPVVSTTRRHRR